MANRPAPKGRAGPPTAARTLITTSWDDGHALDARLAALLKKYRIAATFYIAPFDREFAQHELLTTDAIVRLAADFEIGAHTITHPVLTKIPLAEAEHEITSSKRYLEQLTKKPVVSFCYPRGAYNSQLRRAVRGADFTSARTVERHRFTAGDDPMITPTTFHCYRHYSDIFTIFKLSDYNPLRAFENFLSWDTLAIRLFDRTVRTGGVFHLWGHSWELDKHGDWNRLERVLKHIAAHAHEPGVRLVTNAQVAEATRA